MSGSLKEVSARFLAGRHGLMAFIHWLVRDRDAAEDIFQDVWILLAEACERGAEIDDPVRWARYAAKNLILHHWRGRRSAKVTADSQLVDLAAQAFDEQLAGDSERDAWARRRNALEECVRSLPAESKEMLALKYERGLPVVSVAERLERTEGAVKMALSRLRRALSECVAKRLGEAGPCTD